MNASSRPRAAYLEDFNESSGFTSKSSLDTFPSQESQGSWEVLYFDSRNDDTLAPGDSASRQPYRSATQAADDSGRPGAKSFEYRNVQHSPPYFLNAAVQTSPQFVSHGPPLSTFPAPTYTCSPAPLWSPGSLPTSGVAQRYGARTFRHYFSQDLPSAGIDAEANDIKPSIHAQSEAPRAQQSPLSNHNPLRRRTLETNFQHSNLRQSRFKVPLRSRPTRMVDEELGLNDFSIPFRRQSFKMDSSLLSNAFNIVQTRWNSTEDDRQGIVLTLNDPRENGEKEKVDNHMRWMSAVPPHHFSSTVLIASS